MKFSEIVDQATALLQRKGRLSYRALKMEFDLDDDQLDVLKEELIEGQLLATDENGKVLVWIDGKEASPVPIGAPSESQTPASYTPPHLAERILAEQAAMEARGASDGERKTITALFADLKGSTALIEGLDPEDARAIIDPALQIMMDAVHRYDGYVAQALGDGIFALFGAPIAHEDHAQRALYAALKMQDEMQAYSNELRLKGGAPLEMRIGVNTGEVVVRSIRKDDLHTDYVPVGHSTNLAARMEQMANAGSILVTEYTRKLTEGYFDLKAIGAAEIKGVDGPLEVYEVLGTGPLRTRLEVSASRGLTRFVGRQGEMDQLKRALAEAREGHGQIVGVMGEPGLGKSRLFYEFKLTSQAGCLVLEAFSVSHSKASAYLPIIELLKDYFEITVEDHERKRREKVTGRVLALDRSLEDTLPYLFSLLGIDDQNAVLQQMDTDIRRHRTFDALKRIFLRESLNQPLIVIFEDLHWIDTETQAFLDTFAQSEAAARILLLVNYRPEYRHDWGGKTYYTQLRLTPLGRAEAEEMLAFLVGDDAGLDSLKQRILERTEGTPFFMEEVVLTLDEEGVLSGKRGAYRLEKAEADLHIPPTVQGVLAARIDRLSAEEKHLLQQLAVVGREFPLGLVRQVVAESESDLYRLLSSLQAKEFLYEQPAFPEVEYIFKHALTQEVAYGTVLHDHRRTLHAQTARAIEALYAENLDDHFAEVARHYIHAGDTKQAVVYLQRAAQFAIQRSVSEEAVMHLTQALAQLDNIDDAIERAQTELELQLALGGAFMNKGWGTPGIEAAFSRAHELCRELGETKQLFPVLIGSFTRTAVCGGTWATAREYAEELMRLAEDDDDDDLRVMAHAALMTSDFMSREPLAARLSARALLDLYDAERHHALFISRFGSDLGAFAFLVDAAASSMLGYPDQALDIAAKGAALVKELGHLPTQAVWDHLVAMVPTWHGNVVAVEAQVTTSIELSTRIGFPIMLARAIVHRAWAVAEHGQTEQAVELAREGIRLYHEAGEEIWLPFYFSLVAEILGKDNQPRAGLDILTEALEMAVRRGERFGLEELYRIKGELILQAADDVTDAAAVHDEAETLFRQALDLARDQQTKSFELHATTSLARLWQKQGKQAEAHELLSEIYNWFTEGFDTKGLMDAKALLEELA